MIWTVKKWHRTFFLAWVPIQKEMINGKREITEVKLYEVSAVTLAANDQAMILDVKGNVDPNKVIKRYDNIARLIHSDKFLF